MERHDVERDGTKGCIVVLAKRSDGVGVSIEPARAVQEQSSAVPLIDGARHDKLERLFSSLTAHVRPACTMESAIVFTLFGWNSFSSPMTFSMILFTVCLISKLSNSSMSSIPPSHLDFIGKIFDFALQVESDSKLIFILSSSTLPGANL